MKKTVEEFIYPNELLRERLPALIDYYTEDYGEEYFSAIGNRLKNTLYVFDSNPIETMNFVISQKEDIADSDYLKRMEAEYNDYQKALARSNSRIERKYCSLLASYFSLPLFSIRKDLVSLDIESYSYHNLHLLANNDISDTVKEKILKRQEEYRKACASMGIEPITNPTYISMIIDRKRDIIEKEHLQLLKSTKWGKRMIRTFRSQYPAISILEISRMMRDDTTALINHIVNKKGEAQTMIVCFPLIRSLALKGLDLIFYHENRHVVESSIMSSGINYHTGGSYKLINEIHTEKNALIDVSKLPTDFLWSSDAFADDTYNVYQGLFPYSSSFFEDNRNLINGYAIKGDIASFEETFGKEELMDFEIFLAQIYHLIKENNQQYESEEQQELGIQLVKKLQSNRNRQNK